MGSVPLETGNLITLKDGSRFTNKHNLPAEVVEAILKDRYIVEGEEQSDFSASILVSPTQKVVLEKRHKGNLKVFDVTDNYWSFFGSIAHQVLEEAWHKSMGSVSEHRLYTVIGDKVLSGKMDCYHSGEIRDYKTTKVYKIMKGDFFEWEKAQNVYAFLCRMNKWPVHTLKIIALLTDWKKGEAAYKKNYPECPIITIPLRLWSEKEAASYVHHRIQSILSAEQTKDDEELAEKFPCSDAECWSDVKDYAIFKNGVDANGRATKSCESQEEAEQYIGEKGWHSTHYIQRRMTGKKRCLEFCAAAPHCKQWAKEFPHAAEEDKDTLF